MCHAGIFERELAKFKAQYGAEAAEDLWEEWNGRRERDPKHFKMDRITYPGMYAPVVRLFGEKLIVEPMRYGIYGTKKGLTNYVARRDNLTSYHWEEAFGVNHGFVVASAYLESVPGRDLITGGVISLADIERVLESDREARKAAVLAAGKKYKPTPRELKDPLDVDLEIELRLEDGSDMLLPVIFSIGEASDGEPDSGFAVITDPMGPELKSVKDRQPIKLNSGPVWDWLRPGKTKKSQPARPLAEGLDRRLSYKLLPKYGRRAE